MKQALEPSFYYSSELFQTDICKVLNLIFRYFEYADIESSCPDRDIERINNYLMRCGQHSKSPLLKEWAFYTQTSLFIRIINNLPPNAEQQQSLFNMMEVST